MQRLIRYQDALKIILRETRALRSEKAPLVLALEKVLAEDIVSNVNIPPLDNSAMDGYGVRYSDLKGAGKDSPAKLKVITTVQAGRIVKLALKQNQAVRIMTGAWIPSGVDAVVPVEDTKEKDGYVLIYKEVSKLENIRKKGEDVRRNELVIRKGKIIRPGEIGMLASLGYALVKVVKTPRVAILATGDELVDIDKKLPLGKIRNSNSYSLQAAAAECGVKPFLLGIAEDNFRRLRSKIKEGLKYDALILSGGISMGKTDYVASVIKELGVEIKFTKVAQRPGQPFTFGLFKNKPLFCLPGNPVSSLIVFQMYVRRALLKMMGKEDLLSPKAVATLEEEIRIKPGRTYFLRVFLREKNKQLYARLTGPQGSGILKSMVLANGILVIPEGVGVIKKGKKWPIILI